MRVLLPVLLGVILFLSRAGALEERALYQAGGWGLVVGGSLNCPPGTRSHTAVTVTVCCPTDYGSPNSQGIGGRVCCPPGTDCLASLQATPYCADSTWALWNQTLGAQVSYFCCLSGQQGEQSSSAVACTSGAIDFGTSAAQSVDQQPPSGSSAATISVSSGTQTISSTTKSSGTSSSIPSLATFQSDSRKIQSGTFDIPLLGVVGWGFTTLVLVEGFVLVLGA